MSEPDNDSALSDAAAAAARNAAANHARRIERMATEALRPVAEIDLERRVVRSVICTEDVADDGALVLVAGIDLERYRRNPVVLARHGGGRDGGAPTVVGRCLGLEVVGGALVAETQFADTPQALQWAWLYGINPEREAYMRGWSCKADILAGEVWGLAELRAHLGPRYDPDALPAETRRTGSVLAVRRSELIEYSCVEIGADRGALTRAADQGNHAAAGMLLRQDLMEARAALAAQGREMDVLRERVRGVEELVRGRDGRAAATPHDTARVLDALCSLREQMRALAT